MLGKTTEEFQQEILKSIKLKNTSVDVYYQQNVYCVLQFQIWPWNTIFCQLKFELAEDFPVLS